jgi:transcriptional regulator with XRE-family HTH domain
MNAQGRRSKAGVTEIGTRLRRLRKKNHLTQSELARQIGIQQSDLSRMEKGEYRVSLDNLFRILSVFGMGVAEFFEDAPDTQPPTTQPLSFEDMQILQLMRQLDAHNREEVREYLEFKLRKQRSEEQLGDQQQQRRRR